MRRETFSAQRMKKNLTECPEKKFYPYYVCSCLVVRASKTMNVKSSLCFKSLNDIYISFEY